MQRSNPTTYYLAICRYYGSVHNFVMSGQFDPRQKQYPYQFNQAAGKFSDGSPSPCCPDSCAILFSTTPAVVEYESKIKRKRRANATQPVSTKIFYQAYEVTDKQFQTFNAKVDSVRFKSYAPPTTDTTYCELSIGNNCKHTGIALLKHGGIDDPDISTSVLSRMTSRMTVQDRNIVTALFILPVPVNSELKLHDQTRYHLLQKLRAHMVSLAKTSYNHDVAVHKVNELRFLFNRINNANSQQPEDLLDLVREWEATKSTWQDKSNAELMDAQRRTSWLRIFNPAHTRTTALLDDLKLKLYNEALAKKLPAILKICPSG